MTAAKRGADSGSKNQKKRENGWRKWGGKKKKPFRSDWKEYHKTVEGEAGEKEERAQEGRELV